MIIHGQDAMVVGLTMYRCLGQCASLGIYVLIVSGVGGSGINFGMSVSGQTAASRSFANGIPGEQRMRCIGSVSAGEARSKHIIRRPFPWFSISGDYTNLGR